MNPPDATELAEVGGWRGLLGRLTGGDDLTGPEAAAAMGEILAGRATDAQISAFIVALRMKGETAVEVSGMVDAMLAAASPIDLPVGSDPIDIVGTGGAPSRRAHALNVSTMASLVAAGAGARVVKHGNRRASSTSGSADLLEALGVVLELDGAGVAHCLAESGMGFCFARTFHPAMRHAGPVRAELGVPTVFNYLGPLSNPAHVQRQVIGVSDPRVAPTVVGVLVQRRAPLALVVTGEGATDELTTTGPSTVHEVRDGEVTTRTVDAADLGLALATPEAVAGGAPEENAAIARRVLAGEPGPRADVVILNAAAGLVVAGVAADLADGVDRARQAIESGAAGDALERFVRASKAAAAGS